MRLAQVSWFLTVVVCASSSSGFLLTAQSVRPSAATPSATRQQVTPVAPTYPADLVKSGQTLFAQNCGFCHGRDAAGGESGPDLTRSKLVAADVNGNRIGEVVRNGRPEKGMPRFALSEGEISGLVAYIHSQTAKASKLGRRRGVDVSDLQTGNVQAGKAYFDGAGKCSSCHSATGDLAGVARKYQGLKLEEQMLYPKGASSQVTVTLRSGETFSGTLAYRDEFVVGLRDHSGWYRSWPADQVKYTVKAPVEAHAEQLAKYTDEDIHNLMAYLQTLN